MHNSILYYELIKCNCVCNAHSLYLVLLLACGQFRLAPLLGRCDGCSKYEGASISVYVHLEPLSIYPGGVSLVWQLGKIGLRKENIQILIACPLKGSNTELGLLVPLFPYISFT